MKTNFLTAGPIVKISNSVVASPRLHNSTFEVKQDSRTGEFFLEEVAAMVNPPVLYGSTAARADRVLATFEDRGVNTGVLLTGPKGSGKSALAREICIRAGMPTLLVNEPYCGPEFNGFLSAITQPIAVVFDEFEKTYRDEKAQGAILTLLDGIYSSSKLFIATVNETVKLSGLLMNRPGRFWYHYKFGSVSREEVSQYCAANLLDKAAATGVLNLFDKYDTFNFDMMKAICEEMNRYSETAEQVLEHLNVAPESSDNFIYAVEGKFPGWIVKNKWGSEHSPLNEGARWQHTFQLKNADPSVESDPDIDTTEVDAQADRQVTVFLNKSNLIRHDLTLGTFVFGVPGGEVVVTRISKYLAV